MKASMTLLGTWRFVILASIRHWFHGLTAQALNTLTFLTSGSKYSSSLLIIALKCTFQTIETEIGCDEINCIQQETYAECKSIIKLICP